MSSVWDLHLPTSVVDLSGELRFSEFGNTLFVEMELIGVAEVMADLQEPQARLLRDWLSWWLGEGEEPSG